MSAKELKSVAKMCKVPPTALRPVRAFVNFGAVNARTRITIPRDSCAIITQVDVDSYPSSPITGLPTNPELRQPFSYRNDLLIFITLNNAPIGQIDLDYKRNFGETFLAIGGAGELFFWFVSANTWVNATVRGWIAPRTALKALGVPQSQITT